MKAIHNTMLIDWFPVKTVFNTSKIQNESNSQLFLNLSNNLPTVFNTSKIQNESNSQQDEPTEDEPTDCFQYFKDTK